MDSKKELPPPYNTGFDTGSDVPMTSQFQDRGYVPHLPIASPTFEPPYMAQHQPPTPQPAAITTTVTIGSPGARAKGSCPVCHGTSWTGSYPCCAWLCCIFLFPIGIICCCCMRKKKCTKCGFTLG